MSKHELQLRQYTNNDKDIVWKLHIDGLNQTGSLVNDRRWDKDLLNIKNHYLNNQGDFLIALMNNKVIGMGGLRKVDKLTCEIKRMRVNVNFQRKGIGTLILKTLIEKACEFGYKRIILDTSENQQSAKRLYERYGFKEYRRGKVEHLETIFYELYI